MNYIKIVLIASVCISSISRGYGQINKDTIFFSQDETIRQMHTTEKHVGICGFNGKLRKPMGILYSRSGEKLFEHLPDSAKLFDFIPNDRYNQIILINRKSSYPLVFKDELVALDINTKSINWKARAVAAKYIISPDGKYIMTEMSREDDEIRDEFRIINLVDGSILPVDFDLGDYYYATWCDAQRVILYPSRWVIKSNDPNFDAKEKFKNEYKKLSEEKKDLHLKYQQNRLMSEQYYTTQNQKLDNKIDSIDKDHNSRLIASQIKVGDTTATQYVGGPYEFDTKYNNFIIYNIATNEIEVEKSYDWDDNILTSLRYQWCGKINVDEDGNIYVVDYKDRFHQLDNKFNVNWSVQLEIPNRLYKIINEEGISFAVMEVNKNESFLISKSGEKQLLNPADNPILFVKTKKPSITDIIDLKSGIEYDTEKRLLIFRY